jgi:hypothetical protein
MPKAERNKLYGQLIDECAAKIKAITDGSFLAELQEKALASDQKAVLKDFYDYLYDNDRLINNICMVDLENQGLDLKDTSKRKELQKDINMAALKAPQTIDDICKGLDYLIEAESYLAPIDQMFGLDLKNSVQKARLELLQAALMPTMFEHIYELITGIVEDYEECGRNINFRKTEMDDGWEDMKFYRQHLKTTYVADPYAIIPQLIQLITYGSQRISGNEVIV